MKRTLMVVVGMLALAPLLAQAAGECTINEKSSYMGWPTVKMSNGIVEIELLPQIGGRVISARLDGHEFLWANEKNRGKLHPPDENGWSNWKNYGGDKLWTAPQGWDGPGQWPGPGDPTHDGGAFTLETLASGGEEVAVRLTGPTAATTGIQFIREIHLRTGESRVRFINTMQNSGKTPQRWGIWQVTQHNAAGEKGCNSSLWAFSPMNPASMYPAGYNVEFGLAGDQQWQPDPRRGLFQLQYQHSVGKVGLDSSAGWLAVVDGAAGYGFASIFETFPGADYPHKANVEFWVNGKGDFFAAHSRITMPTMDADQAYYLESEVHAPYMELQPGQSGSFAQTWGLCKAGRPVVGVNEHMMVSRSLAYSEEGAGAPRGFVGKWQGLYSFFTTGKLQLELEDLVHKSLGRHDFGRVKAGQQVDVSGIPIVLDILTPVGFTPHYGVLRFTPDGGEPIELDRCWLY